MEGRQGRTEGVRKKRMERGRFGGTGGKKRYEEKKDGWQAFREKGKSGGVKSGRERRFKD